MPKKPELVVAEYFNVLEGNAKKPSEDKNFCELLECFTTDLQEVLKKAADDHITREQLACEVKKLGSKACMGRYVKTYYDELIKNLR